MKRLHTIVAVLIILLGVIHVFFAFPMDELQEGVLWFMGSGVAIVLAGLINLTAADKITAPKTKWVALSSNLLMCCLFVVAIPVIEGPQVYVGAGLFLLATFLSIQ